MAHTKSLGTSKNGRDSAAKRLGVKLHDGQKVATGNIIIRQRGSKYLAGANVRIGADDTLYAATSGIIKFSRVSKTRFDGTRRVATSVAVLAQ